MPVAATGAVPDAGGVEAPSTPFASSSRSSSPTRPARIVRLGSARYLLGGVALGLLGGCLDLALVGDVAFPPTVPGLTSDRPWTTLPIGTWVTDGDVEGRAIAACFAPRCAPAAAVGVFRAEGAAADLLLGEAREPAALVHALLEQKRQRVGKRPAQAPSRVAAERFSEGGSTGFLVRLSRADGTRDAFGVALASRAGGRATVVVVVAGTEDAARQVAREVARGLG